MNFFIPDIGTFLVLEEDWTFTLFNERKNMGMINMLSNLGKISNKNNQIFTLPKGLVLKVDRIYIKKGLSQYSSVTFFVPKPRDKRSKMEMPLNINFSGFKFWVKLHECNGTKMSPLYGNEETYNLFNSFYKEIEKESMEKFGVDRCTKIMSYINKLMGPGKNIANLKTHLTFDQILSNMESKINDKDFLSDYLRNKMKIEIREFKIKSITS